MLKNLQFVNFYILQEENYPTVLISVFVDKPTPFFDEFLDKIENLDYPKSRIFLSITTLVNIFLLNCFKQLKFKLIVTSNFYS